MPELKPEGLAKLGTQLKGQLDDFIKDRALLEVQWLKNLRQYMGKYDPDVLADIPDERSKAYPRDTRVKVKGGVAKMMEMMFPAQENNWELVVDPVPSISEEGISEILAELESRIDEEGAPVPFDGDDIERAVREHATKRKDKMEAEIADQLSDDGVDYPQMCKRIVRSGYIYGFGVAKAPMVRTQVERMWEVDKATGKYVAKKKTVRRPYPEFVRVWDAYPDLAAKAWEDQEMFFERYVLTRHAFRMLADRPDFEKDQVKTYLRENPSGNYTAKSYEEELRQLEKTSNLADRTSRRYEVYRALGHVSAGTMQRAGLDVTDEQLDQDMFVDIWFIDNYVIKAKEAAFGSRVSDQYHPFIYTEDEDSGLTGVGLPEEVRDSQMCLCASTRALMDNMAAIAGPIFEVNVDLLAKGRKTIGPIHSFMTIEREGDGVEAQYPAVRDISTNSHAGDLLAIIAMQRQQLDVESNLPAFLLGGTQQPLGEAYRTNNNMSMLQGSANMVTKDTVRAFDKFTSSIIGAYIKWNMEFNKNEEIKGSFGARAKGNLSLVAKEVRGQALDQFITTLSEEDRAMFDMYGINVDRLKARDLPTDRLLPREEAEALIAQMRQGSAEAAQVEQDLVRAKTADAQAGATKKQTDAQLVAATADATIQEMLSRVESNLAFAKTAEDKVQLENLKMLLTTVSGAEGGEA